MKLPGDMDVSTLKFVQTVQLERSLTAQDLHCPRDGCTHLGHNNIRDFPANLLDEVCNE